MFAFFLPFVITSIAVLLFYTAMKLYTIHGILPDFSKIPEDSSLKQYTADYIYNGSLGEGYNLIIRTIPMSYRVFENPEMAYDSMIYVSEGTPTIIKQAK